MMNMESKEQSYSEIANSPKFKALLKEKKKFIVPMTVFFFAFYFALPILTSYSKVLNTKVAGDITWAWVFAFGQFIMTWALCMIYASKAKKFDKMIDDILGKN
ncbi:MAG: DUF485 domain-containing protein [Bacillaceae bacterium]